MSHLYRHFFNSPRFEKVQKKRVFRHLKSKKNKQVLIQSCPRVVYIIIAITAIFRLSRPRAWFGRQVQIQAGRQQLLKGDKVSVTLAKHMPSTYISSYICKCIRGHITIANLSDSFHYKIEQKSQYKEIKSWKISKNEHHKTSYWEQQ